MRRNRKSPRPRISVGACLRTRCWRVPAPPRHRDEVYKVAWRREVPVTLTLSDGRLLEGVVDLAYEHDGAWTVVDFKTDDDPGAMLDAYSRQVGLYAAALARAMLPAPRGIVLVV